MLQKNNYLFIVFSAMLLTLWACSENSTSPKRQNTLTGVWEWVQTTGGLAGITLTPESEGINITLQFTADSLQKIFVDDSLLASYSFSLKGDTLIRVEGSFKQLVQIEGSRLTLTDLVVDGFTSIYEQKVTQMDDY